MKVFKIAMQVDDYRSLLVADDTIFDTGVLGLDGTSRLDTWTTPMDAVIDGDHLPDPDVISFNAGDIVIRDRSAEILSPMLRPYCELLPIAWGTQSGHVVNVVGYHDCLDEEETRWCHDDISGKRLFIEDYAFVPELVPNTLLFKIEAQCFELFSAEHDEGESFRAILERYGLSGVGFDLVWQSET